MHSKTMGSMNLDKTAFSLIIYIAFFLNNVLMDRILTLSTAQRCEMTMYFPVGVLQLLVKNSMGSFFFFLM